jgi:hypothetical protein
MSKESSQQSSPETDGEIRQELPFCSMSSASWKEWVTKQRLEYSARVRSGLRTNASASLSGENFATPNTMDYLDCRTPEGVLRQATGARKGRAKPGNLREQVDPQSCEIYAKANWPTITVNESKNAGPKQLDRNTVPLGALVGQLDLGKANTTGNHQGSVSWPTASTSDAEGGPQPLITMTDAGFRCEKVNRPGEFFGAKLRDAVETHEKNWSTPIAGDWKGQKKADGSESMLCAQVGKNWLTPRANEPEGDSNFVQRNGDRGNHCHASLSDQAKVPTKRLNPRWVETLMGVPPGWVKCGEGNRTDELRLLGNGVVPATACRAWSVLSSR